MNVYVKGGIAALVAAAGLFAWYQAKEPSLSVNQSPVGFQLLKRMETDGVPEIALKKVDGTEVRLSSHRGKVVIVNFWASWCNPCVEEFPSMMKLVEQFKNDLVVLAVSEDENTQDIRAFMKAMGLPKPGFEIVWDQAKENMKAWGVEKVPETFLVGRDGKLIRKVLGIENWANDDAVSYFKLLTSQTSGQGKPAAPEALAPAADGGASGSASGSADHAAAGARSNTADAEHAASVDARAGAGAANAGAGAGAKKLVTKKSAQKSKKKKHH